MTCANPHFRNSLLFTIVSSSFFLAMDAQKSASQSSRTNPVQFVSHFWPDTAYLDNQTKAALDDVSVMLLRNGDSVAVVEACANSSERDARVLGDVRPKYIGSWLVGYHGINKSRVILRSCNHLADTTSTRDGKNVMIVILPADSIPSNTETDTHDIAYSTTILPSKRADYAISFRLESVTLQSTELVEEVSQDAKLNETQGYILSASCSYHEIDCSEMDLAPGRLQAVKRALTQRGISSRRITEVHNDDGTASIKIFVVTAKNKSIQLPTPRDVVEASAGDYLAKRLNDLHSTLAKDEYQEVAQSFTSCIAMSAIVYPVNLNVGWKERKGTVRVLVGKLSDKRFQDRMQSLDLREYMPYACLYGDVAKYPQFHSPPPGILVKRLSKYAPVQRVTPISFSADPHLEDSIGASASFVEQVWAVSPKDVDPHSFEIALADGTILDVPIAVDKDLSYYIRKLWLLIVALAGIGFFGGVVKVLSFIKEHSGDGVKPKHP